MMRPAALLAISMTRVCSRRAFVAHADDSGHAVSRPESRSKPTAATCPASVRSLVPVNWVSARKA
ncbi:hypothetical protein AMK22_17480 [Streptomyces sp. CB01580]|nr:hypothetical protein AMK22_17480 [Streptomyces sp. CB01580]